MTELKIGLYKAVSVREWGFPYALIAGFIDRSTGNVIAEAYVFRMATDGSFHAVDKQRRVLELAGVDRESLSLLGMDDENDAVKSIFDEAVDYCQLNVNEAWLEKVKGTPTQQNPLPTLQPHPASSWKMGLIRLRLRGLPDAMLEAMYQVFTPDDLQTFLFELPRRVKPVGVRRVE